CRRRRRPCGSGASPIRGRRAPRSAGAAEPAAGRRAGDQAAPPARASGSRPPGGPGRGLGGHPHRRTAATGDDNDRRLTPAAVNHAHIPEHPMNSREAQIPENLTAVTPGTAGNGTAPVPVPLVGLVDGSVDATTSRFQVVLAENAVAELDELVVTVQQL